MKYHVTSQIFFHLLKLIIIVSQYGIKCQDNQLEVVVDVTSTTREMRRIWDNTGLSPPNSGKDAVEYLTSKEQFQNLAIIGSLPFSGISYVRIHWLLDLITVKSTSKEFDYNKLDNLIKWLLLHRLRPGFELMGNPGGLFTDLNSNPETVLLWEQFVASLAHHYIEMFGEEEIMRWRFELWNEPDSNQYNILNLTLSGYLKYAEATMKGLKTLNITVSGPAGTFKDFKHHTLSWSLLQMCNMMISLTGKCSLETITFHKKGDGIAQQVFTRSAEFYLTTISLYPLLKKMSFANNEADILTGWWREEEWRGDVNYAADVAEVISTFLAEENEQNISLAYISNDNAFINEPPAYFNQRTLLTRFQINTTTHLHSQFIRKPVCLTMALLSYLGCKEMPVFFRHLNIPPGDNTRLSVLAAGDGVDIIAGWSAAIVITVSASHSNCSSSITKLHLRLPQFIEFAYIVYQVDNVVTNPRSVWEHAGSPASPDYVLLKEMQKHEEPYIVETGRVMGLWLMLSLQTRCPSVTLVHLCVKPQNPPGKIQQLHAMNVTFNDVLLLWQNENTRCVKTYEVYFCSGDCLFNEFELITNRTIILLSYQFRINSGSEQNTEATRGKYKIRVRDYWDQLGVFSDIFTYP